MVAREGKITYKRSHIRLSVDFSEEILQTQREWNDIFKILKDESYQPRIPYPAKSSFKYEGEIKAFPDKLKLKEFIASRPALQEMLKGALLPEPKKQKYR
uniref:L1 transposable element dsRBD-like domain-containing protein n=1 Tax=Equus caballus TaxID=9796 RepID=A0A9L0SUG0_HORSE